MTGRLPHHHQGTPLRSIHLQPCTPVLPPLYQAGSKGPHQGLFLWC